MESALQKYAYHYKQKRAQEKILSDLKKEALKELKGLEDQSTIIDGVELHVTKKLKATIFPKDIQDVIDELQGKIDTTKENAVEAGKATKKYVITFDAYIPESSEEKVLAAASPDYKKHFKK